MILGYIGGPLSPAAAAAAAADAFPYYHGYLRPKVPGGRGINVNVASFTAGMQRGNAIMIGSSEQLIEKILDAHRVLKLDRFLGQVDWGGLPKGAVEETIIRYAEEIAPAIRPEIGSS